MKNSKQIFITALIVLCSTMSYAQKNTIDSLFVEIDDKIEVKMSIYEYDNLKDTVENDLKILGEILKINNDIPQNTAYTILYYPNKKLSIKDSESTQKVIWEEGKQKLYKFENKCEILSDKYHLYIEYNDLENLISEDLINKLTKAIDTTTANQNRNSYTYNYSFKDNEMVSNEQYSRGNKGDMLSLKAGVGANLIKNQPVIDLSGELAFVFQKKGISKNQYYLTYNLLYDFIDNSKTNLNSFLNLGYRYNLSNNRDDSDWLGVEFGYLISREGDMFDKDTFRFGFNWEVGNSITISPQLYISSEQTFPGLRIGFGF